MPNQNHLLQFSSLRAIDRGRVVAAWDEYLLDLVRDITRLPRVPRWRKLSMALLLKPKPDSEGNLEDIETAFRFTISKPGKSYEYLMIPGETDGIEFVESPRERQGDLPLHVIEREVGDHPSLPVEPQSGETVISLATLGAFDGRVLAVLWDRHLRTLEADVRDREHVRKPRKLVFALALRPLLSAEGVLKRLAVKFGASIRLPDYETPEYAVILAAGARLMFRPDSPENPEQMTLAETKAQ